MNKKPCTVMKFKNGVVQNVPIEAMEAGTTFSTYLNVIKYMKDDCLPNPLVEAKFAMAVPDNVTYVS